MIAHWMLYCLAVGALLSLGALAMERALRAFALPQRGVWAAAIVLMLGVPAAARWLPRAADPAPAPAEPGVQGTRIRLADFGGGEGNFTARIDLAALDRPLALGWTVLSAAAVLALLGAWAVLERRRRGWQPAQVDGVPVLVSPATGPAVIGLFRSRIVLPRWVVADADNDVRGLLLEHEREHLRAGDPRLLALGLAAVAVMPWNPAAWWLLRRLRLAVEVDCDARVLARRADVRAYGSLLLEVGRRGTGGPLMAAAFSEPASFLERRIRIMTSPRVRRPWLRATAFGAAALAAVVAACEAPGPVQPSPVGVSMRPAHTQARTQGVSAPSGVRISRQAIESAVRRNYPEVLRASASESSTLMFVVAPDGSIRRHERLRGKRTRADAPGPVRAQELAQTAGLRRRGGTPDAMVDVVTFAPGQMGPGRVEVVWSRELSPEQVVTTTQTTRERVEQPAAPPRLGTPRRQQTDITPAQARALVARHFPGVARDGTTAEFVWLIVNARGELVDKGDSGNTEPLSRSVGNTAEVSVFKGEQMRVNGHALSFVYVRLTS